MSRLQAILELSKEGREWAKVLLPAFITFITGWHLKQPFWVKKKDP